MKRLLLNLTIVLMILFLQGVSFAGDAERQQSEFYYADVPYESEVIKSSAGTVFGITMSAVTANGWVAVYDVSSASDITSSTEPKIEVQQATQYNTGGKDFPDGLKFYNGIVTEGDNAQGVIYYY